VTLGVGLLYLGKGVFDEDLVDTAILNYTGNAEAWALIDIRSEGNVFAASKSPNFLNTSISPYYTVDNNSATNNIDFNLVRNEPFIYICRDVVSGAGALDSDLNSANTMYLKMPDDDTITEISRGATRLESPEGATVPGYYTYETLAAVIAGINSRLAALGSKALELPETLTTLSATVIPETIPETLENEILVEETIVPTVQELEKAINKICGIEYTKDATLPASQKVNDIISDCSDSITQLRDDLEELAAEVDYVLSEESDSEANNATRLDIAETKFANLITSLDLKKVVSTESVSTEGRSVGMARKLVEWSKKEGQTTDQNNGIAVGSASIPVYFQGGLPQVCTSISLNADSASKVNNSLKFKTSGDGDTDSGGIVEYNGSAEKIISYNTVGASSSTHTHSANYTPEGTVSQPTFTGTGAGHIHSFSNTGSHNHTFTGAAAEHDHTFNGTGTVIKATFTGTEGTASTTYTPAGTISTPTITVTPTTATVNSITDVGTLPSASLTDGSAVLTGTISSNGPNRTVTLSVSYTAPQLTFDAGTLPTKGTNTTVVTGIESATSSQPSFTGTQATISPTYTPNGTVSITTDAPGTGETANYTPTGSIAKVSITPAGDIGDNTVSGTTDETTVTPAGTISQPTFTGTAAAITTNAANS
jgi:hypothetical protein